MKINQGLCPQINALLRYCAAGRGNSVPLYHDNLLVPASRVKKSKRQNTAEQKSTQSSFLGIYPSPNFLKKRNILEASSI